MNVLKKYSSEFKKQVSELDEQFVRRILSPRGIAITTVSFLMISILVFENLIRLLKVTVEAAAILKDSVCAIIFVVTFGVLIYLISDLGMKRTKKRRKKKPDPMDICKMETEKWFFIYLCFYVV